MERPEEACASPGLTRQHDRAHDAMTQPSGPISGQGPSPSNAQNDRATAERAVIQLARLMARQAVHDLLTQPQSQEGDD